MAKRGKPIWRELDAAGRRRRARRRARSRRVSAGAPASMAAALAANFLGHSPAWYKRTIVAFLVLNPVLFAVSPYLAGWALVFEFIFTLAMALRCYPLQPGGLLALEALFVGMTTPAAVYDEADQRHRRGAVARVHGREHLLPEAVAAVRVHERAAEGALEGAARAAVLRRSRRCCPRSSTR